MGRVKGLWMKQVEEIEQSYFDGHLEEQIFEECMRGLNIPQSVINDIISIKRHEDGEFEEVESDKELTTKDLDDAL